MLFTVLVGKLLRIAEVFKSNFFILHNAVVLI